MFGHGFLGQMHETNKQNRELLKNNKRKPFEKQFYDKRERSDSFGVTFKPLTPGERKELNIKLERQQNKESDQNLIVLITSFILTMCIFYYVYSEVLSKIKF
jgi:hypothetical protein